MAHIMSAKSAWALVMKHAHGEASGLSAAMHWHRLTLLIGETEQMTAEKAQSLEDVEFYVADISALGEVNRDLGTLDTSRR